MMILTPLARHLLLVQRMQLNQLDALVAILRHCMLLPRDLLPLSAYL